MKGRPDRILAIDTLVFALPDDFNGDLADALQLLADYHRKVDGTPIQDIAHKPVSKQDLLQLWTEVRTETWRNFIDALTEGKRLSGRMAVQDWPDSKNANHRGRKE